MGAVAVAREIKLLIERANQPNEQIIGDGDPTMRFYVMLKKKLSVNNRLASAIKGYWVMEWSPSLGSLHVHFRTVVVSHAATHCNVFCSSFWG